MNAALHAGEERVVERAVVERELVGVLDREQLLLRVVTVRGILDVLVELLGDAAVGHLGEAPLQADVAAVDLRDAHAGHLAHPGRHQPIAVDRGAQVADRAAQFGRQRPHLDELAAGALGDR